MIAYLLIAIAGVILGWQLHKGYIRGLYKTMRNLRRRVRGGIR